MGPHTSYIRSGDREQDTDDAYYAHHSMRTACVLLGLPGREILKDVAVLVVVFCVVSVPALGVDRHLSISIPVSSHRWC